MNCPVCDRSLAPTLSICPSCGAMMFDSVREEMQAKITSGRLSPRPELKQVALSEIGKSVAYQTPSSPFLTAPALATPQMFASRSAAVAVAVAKPAERRVETCELAAPKTSPTLVGFQSKNSTMPDWQVQVQNAVQQRKTGTTDATPSHPAAPETRANTRIRIAQKSQIAQRMPAAGTSQKTADPRVLNALRRIDESRNAFLETKVKAPSQPVVTSKPYKFGVVATNPAPLSSSVRPVNVVRPRLVSTSPAPIQIKRDTNKLAPIAMFPKVETVDESDLGPAAAVSVPTEFAEIKRIRIKADLTEMDMVDAPEIDEDIEDLAHFSMRFGAGLFDLIIASFVSLLILSPIALTRGEWFTTAGLLTFGGVCSIFMFLYMTISLGFYGKTMGMRLFSLELVDAVENEYPTLHQAAVSSSVYILSLFFGGAGFLTIFFNEEKRAAHDLLSGTILVREF